MIGGERKTVPADRKEEEKEVKDSLRLYDEPVCKLQKLLRRNRRRALYLYEFAIVCLFFCFLFAETIAGSYLFLTAGLPLNAFPSRCYILTSGRTQHLWSFLSSLFLLAPTTKRQWMREREEREAFPCMWSLLGFLCPDLAITWWFHRLTACSLLSLTSCLPLTVNHLMDSTLERKRNHRNPSVS